MKTEDIKNEIKEYFALLPLSESAPLLQYLQEQHDEARETAKMRAWVNVYTAFQKYLDLVGQKDLNVIGHYINENGISCRRKFHMSLSRVYPENIFLETKQLL